MDHIILNFHGVGPISRPMDDGERNCWLDQDHFEAVLDMAIGQSHVQLTFDDGNSSDFEFALPALSRRGLQAIFFICSDRLDQPNFLSQPQVREFMAHGMGIGSHGARHVSWRRLPSSQLTKEIIESKRLLEKVCGIPIINVACPFGAYDRCVLAALRQAGYRHIYTSDGGLASVDHWIQARTTVTKSMPLNYLSNLIREGGPGVWEQSAIDVRKFFKRLRW